MAKTIANFLVGIGYDYDSDGERQVSSGIDSLRSRALQLGATVAGAFGIRALTTQAAAAADELGKTAELLNSSAIELNAARRLIETEAGDPDAFTGFLLSLQGQLTDPALFARLQETLASTAARLGVNLDLSVLDPDLAPLENFARLSDEVLNLTQRQRNAIGEALGLDEAGIRLLGRGSDQINTLLDQFRRTRPLLNELATSSAVYNDQNALLIQNIAGFADRISNRLIPSINDVVGGTNDWIDANRDLINSGIDATLDTIEDNFAGIAVSLGLITAGTTLSGLGRLVGLLNGLPGAGRLAGATRGIGAFATRTGLVGAAGVTGFAAGSALYEEALAGTDISNVIGQAVAQTLAFFGNEDAQRAVITTFNANRAPGVPAIDSNAFDLFAPQPALLPGGGATGGQSATGRNQNDVNVNITLDNALLNAQMTRNVRTQATQLADNTAGVVDR